MWSMPGGGGGGGPKKIEEKIEFGAKKIDFCKNW